MSNGQLDFHQVCILKKVKINKNVIDFCKLVMFCCFLFLPHLPDV